MSRAHVRDGRYPVSPLKDLFLAELAAANPDSFSPTRPLRSSRTAAGRRALPCCIVRETPPRASEGSFYYGIDANKYVLLQLAGGGPPIRATRWLAGAVEGQTVCHSCDTPACIAVAHLQVEDQAFNLAECLSRKRRHPPTSSTPQHRRHRHHSNTQPQPARGGSGGSARETEGLALGAAPPHSADHPPHTQGERPHGDPGARWISPHTHTTATTAETADTDQQTLPSPPPRAALPRTEDPAVP